MDYVLWKVTKFCGFKDLYLCNGYLYVEDECCTDDNGQVYFCQNRKEGCTAKIDVFGVPSTDKAIVTEHGLHSHELPRLHVEANVKGKKSGPRPDITVDVLYIEMYGIRSPCGFIDIVELMCFNNNLYKLN